MRLVDGRYECTRCGAILDIPPEATELVEAAEIANLWSDEIVVPGVIVHRCEFPPIRERAT